ncbi:putative phosphoesterase [Phyllobacterium sp. YR620]|uniref:ligase-associated DNA damage response endonuclease PdeM n=1 Tax=Phyllobacterium sp. SYP-B3895 TaxID=2663240 RepID=UPI0008840170|nr:ligase-associated DNA damage response endonuclease PdeM [Phyllobacterium sp. SYP-B3895]SDP86134.1 putative phosphoesterase [Phyllobacterium sp. YR620]
MNPAFHTTKTALHGSAQIAVAGHPAIGDPSGALYLEDDRVLIVSDLHFEKGSSFARRGMMLPPYDTASTLAALAKVMARYDPACVISLGDSFHDGKAAARLPAVYAAQLAALMAGREWIWITGNHDPEHPADLPGETFTELAFGNLIFRHEPSKFACRGEIAGHLHPAAKVVHRGQSVQRRCFVSDHSRLIMPAFGAYTGGMNIMSRAFHGLFDIHALTAYMLGRARVYAMAGKALYL